MMKMMKTNAKVPPKQRLAAERLRRRWTQLEVADQLGTTPGNVSRWERGLTSPGPYFRSKLCELFGMSAHDLGLTWEASEDLVQVQTLVDSSTTAARLQAQTHPGRGDDGSAQTALEAACGSREGYVAVLWVKANPREVGDEGLARLLGGLPRPEQGQERLAQAVTPRLRIPPDRVLVLDQVEEVRLVVDLCWLLGTSVQKNREHTNFRSMNMQMDTWATKQKDDAFSLSVEEKQRREANNAQESCYVPHIMSSLFHSSFRAFRKSKRR